MTFWTDEMVAELRRMWSEGKTSGEIADALGAVSRNAVCGKAHRLGLMSSGARPKRTERPRRARQRPYTPTVVQLPDDAFTGPSWAPAAVMALKHTHCQWPLGDPRSPDFRYCGSDTVKGSSWCRFHQRMAVGIGTPSERQAVREAKRIAAWEARLADLVDAEHAAKRVRA